MGKTLNILRKLIKEEIDNYRLDEASMEAIVDYLLDDKDEQELDEAKGRTAGTGKMFKLKGNKKVEDVEKFLKRIQSLISKKSGKGRRPLNFTDEDIKNFSELLTREEGFSRHDILDTISFYKGKPFQAAQKMMDVLGDPKMSGNYDKDGNPVEIGKGYIESVEVSDEQKSKNKEKINNKKNVNPVDDEELEDLESQEDDEPEAPDDSVDVAPNEEPIEDEEVEDEPSEIEIGTIKDKSVPSGEADELSKLEKQKEEILKQFKSGEIDINQYKEKIGDIPAKIKKLKAKLDSELEVEEDDEVLNEDLVRMFQKRAGLLND